MKKKIVIFIFVIFVLIILAVVYYFMPKTFGKNVNSSEVDHINVFDGNTGTCFTITNPEDIKYIVENIQSHSMKKDGISLGRKGYSLKISYIDSNDKDVIPSFILNSDDTVRKDPFFYVCDGGLCFDYIKECEEKYTTNTTEIGEEKLKNEESWSASEGDYPETLMVNGTNYYFTNHIVSVEVDDSVIQQTTSYAENGVPQKDGESNFDRENKTLYAVLEDGMVVVLIDNEWIEFKSK